MNVKKIEPELRRLTVAILGQWSLCEIARRTGASNAQAVYSWKASGNIPLAWRPEVLRMAMEDRTALDPLELVYLWSLEKIPAYRNLVKKFTGEGSADGA